MTRDNGHFEALINLKAYRETADDRALIARVTELSRTVIPGLNARWAGSQRKGTAIDSSDLDLCLETPTPVTEAARRKLREGLETGLGRPAQVLSHAVRLPRHGARTKVDIAFANAAFGSRPLPDVEEFHNERGRQGAARAMKLWTRAPGSPYASGWVVEALVVHRDAPRGAYDSLTLFGRIVAWLDESATPGALEGILRPRAAPRWNPDWSRTLPGRLEAHRNRARDLRRRRTATPWKSADDVLAWLCG